MYAINYEGLKKRDTYNEIIDYIQNKQDKIQYPDRTAKQLRNTPQLSNLLDGNGEGYQEMEEQQKRNTQEIEKENIIRNMASDTNQSAKVLKSVKVGTDINTSQILRNVKTKDSFAQATVKTADSNIGTKNPIMQDSASQAYRPKVASSSTQSQADTYDIGTQAGPQIFDMALDDDKDDHAMQVDTAIADQERDNTQQVRQIVENHLGAMVEHSIPYLENQPVQSMEVNTQQKRQVSPEEAPKPKAKTKTSRGDEVVIADTPKPKAKAKARSSSRRGTRQETDNPEGNPRRPRSRPPPANTPASSYTERPPPPAPENQPEETQSKVKAKPVKKTIEKDRPVHNIEKDTNPDPKYWGKKSTTIGYIKNQLEQHHGARFTKSQIKGMKKEDYVKMIKEKLKI